MNTNPIRKSFGAAIALSLGLLVSGCGGMADNQTLESVHQPVVKRTNYTLDLTSGPGGLSIPEQRRLAGWFEAMDLRYGDRIALDDPLDSPSTRSAIEAVASRFGLLVGDGAPVTAGYVNAGAVRVIVSRSTASVPTCPAWTSNSDFNPLNGTSSNYGCATNSNLASMVADPEHLIRGSRATGETTVMSSTKAIDSFREAKPTGEGGLKNNSTQNGN